MIQIKNLYKKYGNKTVLEDINLEITGGIHGLLGRNGSGKTTLIKILATLIKPTSGEYSINGISTKNVKKIRNRIGYIPQEFELYPEFSCFEFLDYLLLLDGIKSNDERNKKVLKSLEMVNLLSFKNEKIKNLSGGMRRRECIAQALINSPQVILADEPTANLDLEERISIGKIFSRLKKDSTIIISSHFIEDLQDCCDTITIMDFGKILYNDMVKNIVNNEKNEDASLKKVYLSIIGKKE